ncbi:MAG: taurine dioxygenase [Gammaproteobacteria bacterium]|nr:taurine dioxygenase [Gammaproteobacteria bacterium]
MSLTINPNNNDFGASITGIDLSKGLSNKQIREIRNAWVKHRVISFPNQPISPSDLELFSRYFGKFGNDPYVSPIAGYEHIIEVRREPDEKPQPFGSSWHSDWSFQEEPPSGTILLSKIIPNSGGDTQFADGFGAFESLDQSVQQKIEGLTAVHSAQRPYSHKGYEASGGRQRSMKILPSDEAYALQEHPIVRTHPESGRKALWINPVYTIRIKGISKTESKALLDMLYKHYTQAKFIHTHKWEADMVIMWDNRSLMHRAQGGYDGQLRVMHRTTIAGDKPFLSPS